LCEEPRSRTPITDAIAVRWDDSFSAGGIAREACEQAQRSELFAACRNLETDLTEARRQASELRVQAQTDMADRAALVAALARLVNLSGHPLFVPQSDLAAWDERIEEARVTLARVQS
jgi:hypothetical protein